MSGILLNANGDADITNGKLSLTTKLVAVKQRISQRLKLFLGEWFLERSRGVPYHEQILIKSPNPTVIDAVIKREILGDPAVLELQEFELDLETTTRVLTVTFRALTDDGPLDFSEAFGT